MQLEFPMKTSRIGGLAGCARLWRSWNMLCCDGNGARSTAKARRSCGGGDWKNREERRTTTTALELYRAAKEARRSHGDTFPTPARSQGRHARAWNAEDGRRPCSFGGEHCSQNLQVCHSSKFTNYSQIFITTQKSPKTKVVQNQKFYNFAFNTNP